MGKNRESKEFREKKEPNKSRESRDLAQGDGYRSDRKVVHKEAVIRMIRALSGETYLEDTADIMKQCEIREEDEITVCELFDQYWRGGLQEGRKEGRDVTLLSAIKALMENTCWTAEQAMKALNVSESEQKDYLARL